MVGSDSIFHDVSNEERHKMIEMAEEKASSGSKMVAFVGINGKPAGAIVFGDKIRSGVDKMIKEAKVAWC